MKNIKYLLLIIFLWSIFYLVKIPTVFASENSFVTIVNPIRGNDFWSYKYNPLDTSIKEYEIISKNHLPATWLVRYDALTDANTINFLKSLNNQQEVGLFLEVVPTLTDAAKVIYRISPNWHYARSILLAGYSLEDRMKMIDTAVSKYKEIFGVVPKSVGSWWIDAFSLDYLHSKYGIEANLDVADQYSTDQYQVWGQYWSTPFYPSKTNALMPAQSLDKKIGVVTIQWATRDPYNAYGNGVGDSTYSIQANDYLLHKLDINYFKKLLQIYPQVTVGLENDFDWQIYGNEYKNQIDVLTQKQSSFFFLKTMSEYADFYKKAYPDLSPNVLISSDDPLGSSGKVVWYQTTKYRIGWFYNSFGSVVRDLRIYSDSLDESCYKFACNSLNLATSFVNAIDDVTYDNSWVLDDGKISDIQITHGNDSVQINYINQAGKKRFLKFLPNDIETNEKIQTLSVAIANATIDSIPFRQKVMIKPSDQKINYWGIAQNQLINFAKFIVLTLFFFLIPGWVLTRRLLLSIPVGWAFFTLISYGVGYLHQDLLLWLIPICSLICIVKIGLPKIHVSKLNRQSIILFFVIIFGSTSWLLTTVKNGLIFPFGMGYWGPNGHDGIWHLALISELQRNFPPQNPVFAGIKLNNYHYFFDLLLARSGSLLAIDNQDLLFRFFPLFIAILAGVILFKVVEKMFKTFEISIFSVFFLYFGGSFGWLVSWFRERNLGGESMFWAQQAISTLLNPPFAISIVLLLAGFYLFLDYQEDKKIFSIKLFIPLTLLWGTLIEFKAYAGILLLGGLGLYVLERIIIKKDFKLVPLLSCCGILSLIVFLPNNLGSNSLLIFSPFWFINSMVMSPDRLGWERLSMAMQSPNNFKLILSYTVGIVIFIFGNLSTRILAIGGIRKMLQFRLLCYVFLLGLVFSLFTIQKGTNWNTIQFFYYNILIFNIAAAVTVAAIYNKLGNRVKYLFLIILFLLTIPTTLSVSTQYIPNRPPARLPLAEIEALNFLKTQPNGIVLTLPFDSQLKNRYLEPVPLVGYVSSSYVAAFSNHPTFLDDTINLDILGIDYKGRLNEQKDFIKIIDDAKNNLKRNNISYIYVLKSQRLFEDEGKMGIKNIFENEEVKIFTVL